MQTPPSAQSLTAQFTAFMHAYQDMVFSTAARLTGSDAQAEDISQQVFLKAYENFAQLSTSPTAGGWLKTVATNLALNHLSRYRKRWRLFSELPANADDSSPPEHDFAAPDTLAAHLDAYDNRAIIERALQSLPDHQRVAIVLYHFEDLTYEQIAAKLRISLAKVKTDISRGRHALGSTLALQTLQSQVR